MGRTDLENFRSSGDLTAPACWRTEDPRHAVIVRGQTPEPAHEHYPALSGHRIPRADEHRYRRTEGEDDEEKQPPTHRILPIGVTHPDWPAAAAPVTSPSTSSSSPPSTVRE
jgi:hypothetical protein